MKFRTTLLCGALVAACATPADKITAALIENGIPAARARCMGDRLQDKLSLAQLQRLDALAKANRGRRDLSLGSLSKQLDRDGDPKLVAAVVGAGLRCLI